MTENLVVLELNEVNFHMMLEYAAIGVMPNFKAFIEAHGYSETTSEIRHDELEPWIQWVTVHTGIPYEEHGIFRLGDANQLRVSQIWEQLENAGLRVGAISPMNATNRLSNAAFFVPDPWTKTPPNGPWIVRQLALGLTQAINDNAKSRLTLLSALRLALGTAVFARASNYLRYLRLLAGLPFKSWNKVLFLDLFLSDLFIVLNRSTRPNFSTIFLNGAAHLQHHYMFNSKAYRGANRNPRWYVGVNSDPVGEIYRLYDDVIGQVRSCLSNSRIMIVTGLHQEPTAQAKYYWRLRDHASLLNRLGIRFSRVDPRMSRDFFVSFNSTQDKTDAVRILSSATIEGQRAFDLDLRNDSDDLFVELRYPSDLDSSAALVIDNKRIENFRSQVVFVALKNGQHNGIGYFADSDRRPNTVPKTIPLTNIYTEVLRAFELPASAV